MTFLIYYYAVIPKVTFHKRLRARLKKFLIKIKIIRSLFFMSPQPNLLDLIKINLSNKDL